MSTDDSDFKDFSQYFDFALDTFQIEACRALESNRSVLVAAPTGSGKTVVGEFAVHLAIRHSSRAFYTTPIKALSNQKFRDLVARYGEESVGLLTGDSNINGDAPIVVMTTEVLRNMLYENSDALAKLSHVVMDEVHYLADRSRGAVWEEVILHLPDPVRIAALSATVSNAEEFGAWLDEVRGSTEVIVEEARPVPLDQHVMTRRTLLPLFGSDGNVNHELVRLRTQEDKAQRLGSAAYGGRGSRGRGQGKRGGRQRLRGAPPRRDRSNVSGFVPRARVIEKLDAQGLLPAIVFIFSRAGCEQAVHQVLKSEVRLTNKEEVRQIRDFVDDRCLVIPDGDLDALNYYEWRSALEKGIAAHHAGMLPLFKEVVEELFSAGLVKLVFATETLALGINMPARTVVLERFIKWNGQAHVELSPGEYTQLIGRAGRRGIDNQGHAVAVWHSELDPRALAGLATTRTYPLKSSFHPSYNMAVNLISRMDLAEARELLEASFAQYQADHRSGGIQREIERNDEALDGYTEAITKSDGEAKARWEKRRYELNKRNRKLRRRLDNRTNSISRQLDNTCEVLEQFNFLERDGESYQVTDSGQLLKRIYVEQDLVTALCLREGVFEGLTPEELAGLGAAIVFENRKAEEDDSRRRPRVTHALNEALDDLFDIADDVAEVETRFGTQVAKRPALGFVRLAYAWAAGESLHEILNESDISAGDFVRWIRQLVDLLGQIAQTAQNEELSRNAVTASELIQRGVVTYTSAT